jgi:hypothetical protein
MSQQSGGQPTKADFDEHAIYEDLKNLIMKELAYIKSKTTLQNIDVGRVYTLTRIYSLLKDDLREDVKSDLWKKLGVGS